MNVLINSISITYIGEKYKCFFLKLELFNEKETP